MARLQLGDPSTWPTVPLTFAANTTSLTAALTQLSAMAAAASTATNTGTPSAGNSPTSSAPSSKSTTTNSSSSSTLSGGTNNTVGAATSSTGSTGSSPRGAAAVAGGLPAVLLLPAGSATALPVAGAGGSIASSSWALPATTVLSGGVPHGSTGSSVSSSTSSTASGSTGAAAAPAIDVGLRERLCGAGVAAASGGDPTCTLLSLHRARSALLLPAGGALLLQRLTLHNLSVVPWRELRAYVPGGVEAWSGSGLGLWAVDMAGAGAGAG